MKLPLSQLLGNSKRVFFLISAFSSHLPATTGLFSPQPQGNYSLVPSVSTLDRVGIVWGWLYFGFCRKGSQKAIRLITQTYSNAYVLCTIVLRAPWFLSLVLDAIPNVDFSSAAICDKKQEGNRHFLGIRNGRWGEWEENEEKTSFCFTCDMLLCSLDLPVSLFFFPEFPFGLSVLACFRLW